MSIWVIEVIFYEPPRWTVLCGQVFTFREEAEAREREFIRQFEYKRGKTIRVVEYIRKPEEKQ